MDYEQLGTSAVIDAISKTSRLKAYINSGDKEPSYDGFIYIHNNKKYQKTNLKRVYTQVKGKGVKKGFKETIRYPISVVDLNNFMNNGGAMYFVVSINIDEPDKKQIYYISLLPFKITEILKNKPKNKKTISVQLTKFPAKENDIIDLFLNFHSNAQKQMSFINKKIPTVEELKKQGKLESLTFSYISAKPNITDLSYPKILDGKEIYLYANIKGGVAPIPVEYYSNLSKFQMSRVEDVSVSVNGKVYYDKIERIITSENITFSIGSSFKFTVLDESNKDEFKLVFTVKLKGTLKERIKSIEFLIAMFEMECFQLDETIIPVKFADSELKKLDIDNYPNMLKGYRKAEVVLKKLNIKKDLDLDSFTKDDYWKLNTLIKAIEDGSPVENENENLPALVNLNFGGLHLRMICEKRKDGKYNMWDYFNKHVDVCVFDEDDNPIPTSQFSIMKAEDFLELDNLCLKSVFDDFKNVKPQEIVAEHGNKTMLEMLKAYDKKPSDELMDAIKQMLEWLKTVKEYLSDEILLLNELQTLKRIRDLNITEKQELFKIATNSEYKFCKIGALLLLDEQTEANNLMKEMSEEEKAEFKTFPICRFWNQSED